MRLYHQFNGQSFQLKDGGGRSEISLLSYPGKGLGVGFQLQAERHSSLLLLNFTSHLTHALLRGEHEGKKQYH